MTEYAVKNHNGDWVAIRGNFTCVGTDFDIQYPFSWLATATPEMLDSHNIREITIVENTQQGHSQGIAIVDVNGRPVRQEQIIPYTVQEAYDIMWDRTKEKREQRILDGAPTPLGVFDADTVSRVNIAGAVQLALLAKQSLQPFQINWTRHDNTTVMLSADQMITVGSMIGAYVSQCYTKAQTTRAKIKAKLDSGDSAESILATPLD